MTRHQTNTYSGPTFGSGSGPENLGPKIFAFKFQNIECRTNQDSVSSIQCTFRISKPGNEKQFYLTHVFILEILFFEILTLLSYVRNCFRWGDLIVPSSPGVARRRTLKRLISRCVYKFEMREYFNWINMHLGHVTRIPIYFIGL